MTKVLAVIHHRDDATSLANARVAARTGCEGVVLIQMDGRDGEIDDVACAVKRTMPDLRVVANRLSSPADAAIRHDVRLGLDGTWSDDMLVDDGGFLVDADALDGEVRKAGLQRPGFSFFGSVAFKGQRRVSDVRSVAALAATRPWIVTTSGPGTGVAPDPAKLATMASRVPRDRFAVASGVTPDNAADLLPHVGWCLVATGVSSDFHTLDEDLLARVVRIASTEASPGTR